MHRTLIALGLVGLAAAVLMGMSDPPKEGGKKAAPKPTMLDALKPLAGTWEKTVDGKTQVVAVCKVTSAGSVFQEVLFPGSEHEMTNMYHMDGDALVMTHYCAIGNQPRLKCTGVKDGNVYEFVFDSATNLKNKNDMYMGKLVLTIKDNDHITEEWTSFKDQKPVADQVMKFEHTRQKDK